MSALAAWATIFGAISLHRFGHTTNVIADGRDWFVQTMGLQADRLGLTAPGATSGCGGQPS